MLPSDLTSSIDQEGERRHQGASVHDDESTTDLDGTSLAYVAVGPSTSELILLNQGGMEYKALHLGETELPAFTSYDIDASVDQGSVYWDSPSSRSEVTLPIVRVIANGIYVETCQLMR